MIEDYKKWSQETRTVQLPSGLVVKIRRMPTTAFLKLLDLGETARSKPSEVARIIIPSCLVEPKLEIDEIQPIDVIELLNAIVEYSGLNKLPFRTASNETGIGSNST